MNESPKHEEDYRGYTIVTEQVPEGYAHILTDQVVAYLIMTSGKSNIKLFKQLVDQFIDGV